MDLVGLAADATPLSDDRLTVMGLLGEISAGLEARIEAQLATWKLTPNEFGVLLRLGRSPGQRLRMTDLAAQIGLSNSGLTRLVDRLESTALLRREACPSDRRGSYAVLTDDGRAVLAAAVPGHLDVLDEWLFAPLPPEQLAGFVTSLRALRDHIAPAATAGSTPAVDAMDAAEPC